jgi:hypothetical protein
MLGKRVHIALAVHREHDAPPIRGERDGPLFGGTLGKAEPRAIGRDDLAHARHPLLVLIRLAQVVLELALEVAGRRLVPRRELELDVPHLPDRSERRDRRLVAEDGRDDAALGEPERAITLRPAQRQLTGLLRVGEQTQHRV